MKILFAVLLLFASAHSEWHTQGDSAFLGFGRTPTIARGPSGDIHVAYMSLTKKCVYFRFDPNGNLLESDTVETGARNFLKPDMVVDMNNAPHIVFQEGEYAEARGPWYSNKTGNTWKAFINLYPETTDRVNVPAIQVVDDTAYVGYLNGNGMLIKILHISSGPVVALRRAVTPWRPFPVKGPDGAWHVHGRDGANGDYLYSMNGDLEVSKSYALTNGRIGKTSEIHCAASTPALLGDNAFFCGTTGGDFEMFIWFNTFNRAQAGGHCVLGPGFGSWTAEGVVPHMAKGDDGAAYITYESDGTASSIHLVRVVNNVFSSPVTIGSQLMKIIRYDSRVAALKDSGVGLVYAQQNFMVIAKTFGNNTFRFNLNHSGMETPQRDDREDVVLYASPNPFNAFVKIGMHDGPASNLPIQLDINIYDIAGNKVAVLGCKADLKKTGILWNAGNMPPGVYVVTTAINNRTFSTRVTMVR
ncbi:MAG: hypothetical protein A2268_07495 [Candidatus Raymondbacteria bacterium RifOxyA12_full_50_37]|nr:MAG: hypothetical protein A2268_07495 [Candidatus Raymondbacteria bacterium RifOxyA12_full_50_37]OGJ91226.1 MAG: hypothetical protein A2248_01640 [Candidatus Raymondbacteria bacterium RIFOXYA2_FULL_49_16]OGJ96572.1 MAG: hypothetical protein A2350_02820 [Candidatus Raymondbacteria bacterium RifOxyB12_full_50_8]OGJ97624.1 MAG: hypothetical protein A2453_02405 [Candidatus Raymondbacteria bacterium RIFOXYC2_FULL_50_21]OGJ99714.1 MAG: hypothetical protein A2487_18615 [Candidatus Raymondbacteria b